MLWPGLSHSFVDETTNGLIAVTIGRLFMVTSDLMPIVLGKVHLNVYMEN